LAVEHQAGKAIGVGDVTFIVDHDGEEVAITLVGARHVIDMPYGLISIPRFDRGTGGHVHIHRGVAQLSTEDGDPVLEGLLDTYAVDGLDLYRVDGLIGYTKGSSGTKSVAFSILDNTARNGTCVISTPPASDDEGHGSINEFNESGQDTTPMQPEEEVVSVLELEVA